MHRIPRRIDPRNFVGKKFQKIEESGERDDPGMPEHLERLVGRRENDPMEMNREAGDENGEIKIDAGEAGEAQRDAQEVESFHGEISGATA